MSLSENIARAIDLGFISPDQKGIGLNRLARACGYRGKSKGKSVKKRMLKHLDVMLNSQRRCKKEHPGTKKFLKSYEWLKLRIRALDKYGRRCVCCGASPADGVRLNVA